ncbi:uncharacterized protein LOC134778908 [Penaeus indicus]|uniref:uncharacterized protein LOC134778908 n=1 Tax=Penaeus indicus TaxID=29960 RepID=UPI00300CD04F
MCLHIHKTTRETQSGSRRRRPPAERPGGVREQQGDRCRVLSTPQGPGGLEAGSATGTRTDFREEDLGRTATGHREWGTKNRAPEQGTKNRHLRSTRTDSLRTEHKEQKSAENRAPRIRHRKNTSKRPNQRTEKPRTRHTKNTTSRTARGMRTHSTERKNVPKRQHWGEAAGQNHEAGGRRGRRPPPAGRRIPEQETQLLTHPLQELQLQTPPATFPAPRTHSSENAPPPPPTLPLNPFSRAGGGVRSRDGSIRFNVAPNERSQPRERPRPERTRRHSGAEWTDFRSLSLSFLPELRTLGAQVPRYRKTIEILAARPCLLSYIREYTTSIANPC